METIVYEQLRETLCHERLPNGLQVYVLPKPGFQKTYAVFTTKYGSVDNHFQVPGKEEMQVPDGIAHFLEHKMFEEPEGDVFTKFSNMGASANAFTSFDRTAYLFSASSQIEDSLVTLLDFVQNPYFTDQNVEKEKGIIAQEIQMYQDNPDWRVYFGLIRAMYSEYPIYIDIAGTVESITEITKEMLYDCYRTFYHPSNMCLFVVGGIEAERILQLVRDNQGAKQFEPQGEIVRHFPEEPLQVRTAQLEAELTVSLPKCLFGFKQVAPKLDGTALLRLELETKLVLDMLFSPSSGIYRHLYDARLISDSFGSEFNICPDYAFSVIGGDTPNPEALLEQVRLQLDQAMKEGLSAETFERSRRKKIGGFLRMMNSPEAIANEFTKYLLRGSQLFDILPLYEQMTLADVERTMREHFDWSKLAVSVVRSKKQ